MKIWLKSLTRTTKLDTDLIIDKMFIELDKPAYRIVKQSLNFVEFRQNMLLPNWNFNQFKYINGGRFRINPETKTIVLFYYMELIYDVVINSIILLLAVFKDSNFFYFFIAWGITLIIKLISYRNIAKGIIDRVASS